MVTETQEKDNQSESGNTRLESNIAITAGFRHSFHDPMRIPAYGPDRDLWLGGHFNVGEWSAKGPPNSRAFALPHLDDAPCWPVQGETWIVTDDVLHAATLSNLGFNSFAYSGTQSNNAKWKEQAKLNAVAIEAALRGANAVLALSGIRGDLETEAWGLTCEELTRLGSHSVFEPYIASNHEQLKRTFDRVIAKLPQPKTMPKVLSLSEQLAKPAVEVDWLVPCIMTKSQPMIIGGGEKCLKTSIAADLAVSLATGNSFLDHFPVSQTANVLFMSGESGAQTLDNLFRRVCDRKSVKPSPGSLHYMSEIVKLDDSSNLEWLGSQFERLGTEVFFADPVYLSFSGESAENMMRQGERLNNLNTVCRRHNVTLALVHHTRTIDPKTGGAHRPARLSDLSWAGYKEFARQWLLLNRRADYDLEGNHKLWLSAGGSVGHSATYGVDIAEGVLPSPRHWSPSVSLREEIKAADREQREVSKAERAKEAQDIAAKKILDKITETPQTKRELGIRTTLQNETLDQLIESGSITLTTVKRGGRDRDGYSLPTIK